MKKRCIKYIIPAFLALGMPAWANGEPGSEPAIEAEAQPVEIFFSANGSLRVTGAKGEMVYIYNVAGIQIASIRLQSDDETLRLNLKRGGYLIKVGAVTRKIAVTR